MKNSPIKINHTEIECEGKTYQVDWNACAIAFHLCKQAEEQKIEGVTTYFLQENSKPEFRVPIGVLAQTRYFINFITEGKVKCEIRECPPAQAQLKQGS